MLVVVAVVFVDIVVVVVSVIQYYRVGAVNNGCATWKVMHIQIGPICAERERGRRRQALVAESTSEGVRGGGAVGGASGALTCCCANLARLAAEPVLYPVFL